MKILQWIKQKIKERKDRIEREKRFKKKLEEIRKHDPFIYNH